MSGTDASGWRKWWPLLVLLALLWSLLAWSLSTHWSVNPQYSFGWLVLPLAGYLGMRRWNTRPPAGQPPRFVWLLLLGSALLFLPTWLLSQPNPDWRLVNWLIGGEVVAFTLGVTLLLGGKPWAAHFALPISLVLLAIPWPSGPEAQVIGGLMRAVAGVTVALLNVVGIPALQHGNLIEIGTGILGVDEACSGVRSLQATLMAAVALGELYRFPSTHRWLLLASSIVVAFLTNTARAFFLAWSAAHDGIKAVNRWHDPAGFSIMTACFLLVWAIALFLSRGHREPRPNTESRVPTEVATAPMLAFVAWFCLVLGGTELWFRSGQAEALAASTWRFQWPDITTSDLREISIPPKAAEMLRFDSALGESWTDVEGFPWLAYHLAWAAGPSRSRILARMHRPEYCLPSTGWELAGERTPLEVAVGDTVLAFRRLRFVQGQRTVHIWFCTSEGGRSTPAAGTDASARASSIDAVLRRERYLGQQVLEVALFSPASGEEADGAFQREIVPRLQATVPK